MTVVLVVLAGCNGSSPEPRTSGGTSASVDAVPETTASTVAADATDAADTTAAVVKDVVTQVAGDDAVGVSPDGFGSVTAQVTSPDGELCEVCLWLADDGELRARGLMDVTDLGDAVGMAFVWEAETSGQFFMFQTPTPLSIAWFGSDGSHVGQEDMEPCLVDDSARCERYGADAPYTVAVEMFGGQLDAIGIEPGAHIELLDLPCA